MEASAIIQKLIQAAIDSVRPENFIRDSFSLSDDKLTVGSKTYCLNDYSHIYIAAVGKAAVGMAAAVDQMIHPWVTEGIVLTKHIPDQDLLHERWCIMKGGHPVPTDGSVAGAQAIMDMLDKANESDLVLFLISGGGSALMTAPIAGLSLETYQAFCTAVLGCGANINEFNTLRKHLDLVKGGRLAQHAAPAEMLTVILSDVVGNPLDIIASGPTVPDPSTWGDALNMFNVYAQSTDFPDEIRHILERGIAGELPETLKANDPAFAKSEIYPAADNRRAAFAAKVKAEELGIPAQVINTKLTGEAAQVGKILPSFFSELSSPGLLIFGGETTVTLTGSGLGGRNLELALAAVRPMAAYPGCTLITLATDGEDGPTDAAGAIVTSNTLDTALALGCDPDDFLRNNDSYHFFEKVGGLLKPGPSGTNVNDLTFLLRRG